MNDDNNVFTTFIASCLCSDSKLGEFVTEILAKTMKILQDPSCNKIQLPFKLEFGA